MRIHVDTDFAGDTDDAAALAMVLGWPDTELVGVTTVADPDGRRAGYASHLLHLAGRGDVPVAAGAATSLTTGRAMGGLPDHGAYWGAQEVPARPDRPGAATALLAASIDRGATVVAIGPCTNLAVLEEARPGLLQAARVVVMGGWVAPAPGGFPPWGPAMDWNVQCDPVATLTVLAACSRLTMVTLTAAMGAHLRRRHLPRLQASGPVGRLLARQARAHGGEHDMSSLSRAHHRLPADLLNVQWDPVACAVALGWPGAPAVPTRLRPTFTGGALHFEMGTGTAAQVVLSVDGPAFAERWLDAVAAVDRAGRPRASGQDVGMEQVTGIGGIFFTARDADALSGWYAEHLGVGAPPGSYDEPCWEQETGPTVFAPFGAEHGDSPHLGPSGWGINFRVRDLDAMVRQLRAAGIDVEVDAEPYPNGRFAQLHDPEGNAVQLWEPA